MWYVIQHKKNEMSSVVTWMDLEIIKLSESKTNTLVCGV